MLKHFLFFSIIICLTQKGLAQTERLSDNNNINWLAYTGTFKLNNRLSLHTEIQARTVNGITNMQQALYRTGLVVALYKDVTFIAGYAFADTYPYGDYPATFRFPEHRFYEQLVIKNPVGKINLSHRFTLEQRLLGRVAVVNNEKNTEYKFQNRFRYRLRAETALPFLKPDLQKLSIIFLDEVFIGWGKNAGVNIFDQNRIAALVGFRISPAVKLEAGFLNQTLQQGRMVNNKAVYQYNNGLLVNGIFSFDVSRKSKASR